MITSIVFALLANLQAERYLAIHILEQKLERSTVKLTLRWSFTLLGIVTLAALGMHWAQIAFVALFAVTAAVDFESTYLPPDWYMYGCTALNIVAAAVAGPEALRSALVAQMLCFCLGVFLAALGAWAGGDVKLMMQYGAAAGSIQVVAAALFIEQIMRSVGIAVTYVGELRRTGSAGHAWQRARQGTVGPHGGIAFVGLIAAHLIWQLASR